MYVLGDWISKQQAVGFEDWSAATPMYETISDDDRPFFARLDAGSGHCILVSGDHRIWAAGSNAYGQVRKRYAKTIKFFEW